MAAQLDLTSVEIVPEIISTVDKINYIISLSGEQYCLTFIVDGENWFLQHVECIFIRLDKVLTPADSFPDISDQKKNWIRQEIEIHKMVRLFNFLRTEKGKDFALDWFKDGAGYRLESLSWVPFVEPLKAFILYLCWEQSNLYGNETVLESLNCDYARVRIKTLYNDIYKQTHIKQQIMYDDYIGIFDTMWKDRAQAAGWDLVIEHKASESVFAFYCSS